MIAKVYELLRYNRFALPRSIINEDTTFFWFRLHVVERSEMFRPAQQSIEKHFGISGGSVGKQANGRLRHDCVRGQDSP